MYKEWEQKILRICKREGIEIVPAQTHSGQNAFIFHRAEPLDQKVIGEIRETVPIDIPINFKYQDKPSTLPALITLVLTSGARRPPLFKVEGRHLIFDICDLEPERVDRMKIDTILEQDGYFQSWTIKVDGQELYEMNLVGRRLAHEIHKNLENRDQILTDSDVTDLRISLENCDSVDEFLKSLEG